MDDKTISFTIPMERGPLITVAETLMNLASQLPTIIKKTSEIGPSTTEDLNMNMLGKENPAFGTDAATTDSEAKVAAQALEESQKAMDSDDAMDIPPPPGPDAAAPEGVDLDKDGLPWDVRIHGKAKKKTVKDGLWTKTRGIEKKSPGLVEKVEAELRATMAASPQNPITPAADDTPPPPANDTPPPPADDTPPPPAAGGGSAITTFAELMARITADKVKQGDVVAAVNTVGLAGVPSLGARPDLVPAVAVILFGE